MRHPGGRVKNNPPTHAATQPTSTVELSHRTASQSNDPVAQLWTVDRSLACLLAELAVRAGGVYVSLRLQSVLGRTANSCGQQRLWWRALRLFNGLVQTGPDRTGRDRSSGRRPRAHCHCHPLPGLIELIAPRFQSLRLSLSGSAGSARQGRRSLRTLSPAGSRSYQPGQYNRAWR